ncbi:MAG: RidA family protein [Deltaproteobacteria bacterium]|jgi:2-iminobutanoate/2-iminopropanoate deaminase|nr:RidA family protein [Deltaproteobacteria bacterium]
MKQIISTDNAPTAIGPYSQAVITGNLVFVSGQLPIDPATGVMSTKVVEQARQSLDNVEAILESVGSSLAKVVKVVIFMTDLSNFVSVNDVYSTFFSKDYPARSTVQVAALPKGAQIEIEAIAEL